MQNIFESQVLPMSSYSQTCPAALKLITSVHATPFAESALLVNLIFFVQDPALLL